MILAKAEEEEDGGAVLAQHFILLLAYTISTQMSRDKMSDHAKNRRCRRNGRRCTILIFDPRRLHGLLPWRAAGRYKRLLKRCNAFSGG
jgi:hypothetical protein